MPLWSIHGNGHTVEPDKVVKPNERLNWGATLAMGGQHVLAMFGATFTVPILTGFPVATTLLFSGIGTILFLLITRNKLPSYLGSSFAFIAPVTAFGAGGPLKTSEQIGMALVGIIAAGVVLALIGLLIQAVGLKWLERFMPPVVAGTIVALIGLNLAGAAWNNFQKGSTTAIITLSAIVLFSVVFRGFLGRISIFLGVIVGYIAAVIQNEIDWKPFQDAAWIGLPHFQLPSFGEPAAWSGVVMFLPVVLVLIAENVGHVRGVAAMTNDPGINKHTGRALFSDGLSTALAGMFGGSGTTTYGENIGVMAATRVYSTAVYWVAGFVAILLSLSPKIGELFNSIPLGVLGGATTALYGLIGVIGFKIWVDNRVDLSRPVNQLTAAVGLIVSIGAFTMVVGNVQFSAIVLGTIAVLVIYHIGNLIARLRKTGADDGGPMPIVGPLGGDPEN